MVSVGDTDISLHIRPRPTSNFRRGVGGGGWGVVGLFFGSLNSKISKCQDLPKFEFFEAGGGLVFLGS